MLLRIGNIKVVKTFTITIQVFSLLLPWIEMHEFKGGNVVKVTALNIVDSLGLIKTETELAEYYPVALTAIILYITSIVSSSLSLFKRKIGYVGCGLATISAILWTVSTMSTAIIVKEIQAPGSSPKPPIIYYPIQPDIAVYINGILGLIQIVLTKIQK